MEQMLGPGCVAGPLTQFQANAGLGALLEETAPSTQLTPAAAVNQNTAATLTCVFFLFVTVNSIVQSKFRIIADMLLQC